MRGDPLCFRTPWKLIQRLDRLGVFPGTDVEITKERLKIILIRGKYKSESYWNSLIDRVRFCVLL